MIVLLGGREPELGEVETLTVDHDVAGRPRDVGLHGPADLGQGLVKGHPLGDHLENGRLVPQAGLAGQERSEELLGVQFRSPRAHGGSVVDRLDHLPQNPARPRRVQRLVRSVLTAPR